MISLSSRNRTKWVKCRCRTSILKRAIFI